MNNKFRVWVEQFNSYLKSYDGAEEVGVWYIGVMNNMHTLLPLRPNAYTFEQFTGIKDVNGVEIFEGDILKTTEDYDKDCIYDDVDTYTKYSVVEKAFGYFFYDEDEPHGFIINVNKDGVNSFVEVVGNIHYNPELLKL